MSAVQHAHPKHFHWAIYAKKLKKAGVSQEIVEVHTEAMDTLMEDIVHHSGLATETQLRGVETDLCHEIQRVETDLRHEIQRVETSLSQEILILRKDMNCRFEKTDHKIENLQKEMETRLNHFSQNISQNVTLQISKAINKLLYWIFGLSFSLSGGLLAVMAHGFQWV